ncbi:ATP-binding protein [Deferribacter thermophilus]|uniref:two-component system sensor histidine kinase NtrB n=1 Tax=Deferribacter thermophilus TaxID=53573 RepID=UPI003C27280E
MNSKELLPYLIVKDKEIVDYNDECEKILNKFYLSGIYDIPTFLNSKEEISSNFIIILDTYYVFKKIAMSDGNIYYFIPINNLDLNNFFDTGLLQHELKNPLTVISGTLQLLKSKDIDDFVLKCVDVIEREVERLLEFVNNLKIFHDNNLKLEKNSLSRLINELLEANNMIFKKIKFEVEVDPEIKDFYFDYQKMYIALMNIIKNACEAQLEGVITVKIQIDLTVKYLNKDKNVLYPMVKISIIDKGKGIDEDNLKNIFKPFFTTKNKGMGVGLSVAKEIITAHKGKIEINSQPNRGTVFTVLIPYILDK